MILALVLASGCSGPRVEALERRTRYLEARAAWEVPGELCMVKQGDGKWVEVGCAR